MDAFWDALGSGVARQNRLFRYGGLSYHGGFVNSQTPSAAPIPVGPTVWKRMQKDRIRMNPIQLYKNQEMFVIRIRQDLW